MKTISDAPLARLLGGKLDRYEASAVAMLRGTSVAYVLFDNSYAIGRIRGAGTGLYSSGALLAWDGRPEEESDFEFLAFNATDGKYVAGREAVEIGSSGKFHAVAWETDLDRRGLETGMKCTAQFEFDSGNKGYEGGAIIDDGNGGSYLLGLCEGNFCKGGHLGKMAGNGRIVVMRKVVIGDECIYKQVQILKLGKKMNFVDYSDMDVRGNRIAITSQENSSVFVGYISVRNGVVSIGKGKVYDFPRGENCEKIYCNVEGIAFVDEESKFLVAVSDAMKSSQDYRCLEKDQSIHLFQIR